MLPRFYIAESTLTVHVLDENTDTEQEVNGTILKDQARRIIAPFAHNIDIVTEFTASLSTFDGKTFAVPDGDASVGFVRVGSAFAGQTSRGQFIMEAGSFVVPWAFTVETVGVEQRIIIYYLHVDQPIAGFPSATITFEQLSDNPTMVDGDGKLHRAVEDAALPGTDGVDFTLVNTDGVISALVGENEIDQGTNFAAPVSIFKKNLYQT